MLLIVLFFRISFSNLFKEFKSTSTWLQFPFIVTAAQDSVEYQTSRLSSQRKPMCLKSFIWLVLCLLRYFFIHCDLDSLNRV